ncbi:nuclear GTPase SLIP-GC-like [Centropristis striata]|uniref:nuclear GTPase SLIP-GC-like n=1 Tax=Centropristis striata TaxID=184440 RepID=UPI0027E0CFFB|nr:nuclear GTPase SLIP-GC-like [Centropristis striata]
MDDFVQNKLTEWGLSELIDKFKGKGIDKESLQELGDQEIAVLIPKVGPSIKFKKYLKLLKKQKSTDPETVDSSAQVSASTSGTSDKGKRKSDLQDWSSEWQSPTRKPRLDTKPGSYSEGFILTDVKDIMRCVQKKLPNQDNKLNNFLKQSIHDLETDKRELVGVFGKTGAGKSSLINAIIGEKNLLPSGGVSACTTVMIKVEANRHNMKYEAHIEFITKEEWKDELWTLLNFLEDNADQENDEDYCDTVEKLSALYGEEWKNKSAENLMEFKHFKEIPEFLHSQRKILTCESATELSAKLVKYTRSDSKDREAKGVKRWYWPLVKCVTVMVPDNDFLQHVTLADLPGNGDCNKSRDKMWKGVVGSCSTVWVVTELNRAAAEDKAWEILESASSLMGNGGECQRIHFICTKSDQSAAGDRENAKELKHFSDECFQVFTVSAKEFLEKNKPEKKPHPDADDTEIPKLVKVLQDLNDCHSETLNYVSGALGILSLIQGASCRQGDDKTAVCTELEEKMKHELDNVIESMKDTYRSFGRCISEGVENSKSSWERNLKSVLHPHKGKDKGFHRTLKSIVHNGGIHKPRRKKEINLNMKLASDLTDSIDEEFKKTFPNEGKSEPFNGIINKFSLGTKRMMGEGQKYKDVELQLTFLNTEEEIIKPKLNKIIRERKKIIYSSLMTTIEEAMQECYQRAAVFTGAGSLDKMRKTIKEHVHNSGNIMFEKAKKEMLNELFKLMEEILQILKRTMQESIELSLKTDGDSIPDVQAELELVKNHYIKLKGSPGDEPLVCILLTTGSMRRYLQPNQVPQVVQLFQDGTSIRMVATRCIRNHQVPPQAIQELTDAMNQVWEKILKDTIIRFC